MPATEPSMLSFIDLMPSPDFVSGMQIGMLWQQMINGEETVVCAQHFDWEFGPLYLRMAEQMNYYAEVFDCCDETHEWMEVVFHRNAPAKPHLEIVK